MNPISRRRLLALLASSAAFSSLLPLSLRAEQRMLLDRIRATKSILLQESSACLRWQNEIDMLLLREMNRGSLKAIKKQIDFKKHRSGFNFGIKGRTSILVDECRHGKVHEVVKLVGIDQGHGIPPHLHHHMSTLSIVLEGTVRLKQFDRIGPHQDGYIVRALSDEVQHPGSWSSISDDRANLHWFQVVKGPAFVLNINLENLGGKAKAGVRVDLTSMKGNHHLARLISNEEAERRFG